MHMGEDCSCTSGSKKGGGGVGGHANRSELDLAK